MGLSKYLSLSSQRPAFLYWGPFHPGAHRGRCGQTCLSKTNHMFLFEEKGMRDSQRHHIQRSKCHLTLRSPCLADLWTEVSRLLLNMLCLLKGLGSFWLLSPWHEPKQERFIVAKRTFHHLEQFRNTYDVKRPSEHVHHLLCLNCHPIAPGLYRGKMPFKNINHQHKLRKKSEP